MTDRRTPADITTYLHRHIPVSAHLGVSVRRCDHAGVVLAAPLAANINHRSTVFGGSASAVAILAGWTWLHFALRDAGLNCRVVIQRNTMEYDAPIDGDFTAECAGVLAAAAWDRFLGTLRRHRRARAELAVVLKLKDVPVARFEGEYVAVAPEPSAGASA
jgi:thioesterase domain-containing protein